jgi:hypothetical protein
MEFDEDQVVVYYKECTNSVFMSRRIDSESAHQFDNFDENGN